MHVNGAPQMMQPPQMGGGVPGPMPGQGPMGPAGKHSCPCSTLALVCIDNSLPLLPPSTGGMQPQIGIPPGGPVPMDRGPGTHFRHYQCITYLGYYKSL